MPACFSTRTRRLPVAALLALCATSGAAHDFWIEPEAFQPAPGSEVPVTLRVGENFSGTSQPFVPGWFVDFSVSSPTGRAPVDGLVGDDPAATIGMPEAGLRIIGYHSERSFVELDPAKFRAYLLQEGLDGVVALRQRRGEAGVNGREYYSRCAKALVQAGRPGPGSGFDRVLGYPLELVPRADPYLLGPGDLLPVELRYRGQPINGVLVIAFPSREPGRRVALRTGADGRVTIPLDRPGRWLVKAVHMIEVPDPDPQADWESFWASLTFAIPAGPASPSAPR